MRASQNVIRRPTHDEAVPEAVVETPASVTTRIDVRKLEPLMADCVEPEGDDIEIQLEAAELRAQGSQQLPRVRNGVAHTLRRPGTEPVVPTKPMPAVAAAVTKPMPVAEPEPIVTHTQTTTPIARIAASDATNTASDATNARPMIFARTIDLANDSARPIDEMAEERAVETLMSEMGGRRRWLPYAIVAVAVAVGAAVVAACSI